MYIILYILLFLLLIAIWMLLSKVHLEVDSTKDLCSIHFGKVIHAKLGWQENIILVHFKIFFYQFTKKIDLFHTSLSSTKKKKKKSIFTLKNPLQKLRKVLNSFRVHHCNILMDTNDYYNNALFYPVAHFISRTPIKVHVNFQGINSLRLSISNRPIRILTAIFL